MSKREEFYQDLKDQGNMVLSATVSIKYALEFIQYIPDSRDRAAAVSHIALGIQSIIDSQEQLVELLDNLTAY